MTVIVDRREEPLRHKFGVDKSRFLRRIKDAVHQAVQDKVSGSTLADLDKGEVRVNVPKKTTQEPIIHHAKAPYLKKIFPGNLFDVGDTVPMPKKGGGGSGKQGSPDAEDTADDYVWLSEDEYLDIFFEGRSLPDMIKLHSQANFVTQRQRFGHTSKGPSHKLNMGLTNEKRRGEALVLNKASERRLTANLLEQYSLYRQADLELPEIKTNGKSKSQLLLEVANILEYLGVEDNSIADEKHKTPALSQLFLCIETLATRIDAESLLDADAFRRLEILRKRIPEQQKTAQNAKKFQSGHLTYKFDKEQPKPAAKAVMFCKMDVSGSMSQEHKNTAKAFFWVLHRFLKANYDEINVVFITHTTTAEEVDEQEFFYGQRTGGTVVSSCLDKELEIIKERYNSGEWNIYSAQASDGDNVNNDNAVVAERLNEILPLQQASFFIEVLPDDWDVSTLREVYDHVASEHSHLKTARVSSPAQAIERFKEFFPKAGQTPAPQYG